MTAVGVDKAREDFIATRASAIRSLQYECWKIAEDHGWHDNEKLPEIDDLDKSELYDLVQRLINKPPMTFGDRIALIDSESAEALEAFRTGRPVTETWYGGKDGTKPEGVPSELADIIIRVMDLAEIHDIDISAALVEKMSFNRTREYRHGGKVI